MRKMAACSYKSNQEGWDNDEARKVSRRLVMQLPIKLKWGPSSGFKLISCKASLTTNLSFFPRTVVPRVTS